MSRKLLFSVTRKDFDIQTFRSGGPGGQHQNKTDSGVRIIHKESGISAESRSHKSQLQNKRAAFDRLVKNIKFRLWVNKKAIEAMQGKSIEQRVDEAMVPENMRIEAKVGGRWENLRG